MSTEQLIALAPVADMKSLWHWARLCNGAHPGRIGVPACALAAKKPPSIALI